MFACCQAIAAGGSAASFKELWGRLIDTIPTEIVEARSSGDTKDTKREHYIAQRCLLTV